MTFNEDERRIAQGLVQSPETVAFLEKLFAPEDTFGGDIPKNIVALDDAEYGRVMKVLFVSREHFKEKVRLLKHLGTIRERTGGPIAPK